MDWATLITDAAWLTLVAAGPIAVVSRALWLKWRWREWRIERALARDAIKDELSDLR